MIRHDIAARTTAVRSARLGLAAGTSPPSRSFSPERGVERAAARSLSGSHEGWRAIAQFFRRGDAALHRQLHRHARGDASATRRRRVVVRSAPSAPAGESKSCRCTVPPARRGVRGPAVRRAEPNAFGVAPQRFPRSQERRFAGRSPRTPPSGTDNSCPYGVATRTCSAGGEVEMQLRPAPKSRCSRAVAAGGRARSPVDSTLVVRRGPRRGSEEARSSRRSLRGVEVCLARVRSYGGSGTRLDDPQVGASGSQLLEVRIGAVEVSLQQAADVSWPARGARGRSASVASTRPNVNVDADRCRGARPFEQPARSRRASDFRCRGRGGSAQRRLQRSSSAAERSSTCPYDSTTAAVRAVAGRPRRAAAVRPQACSFSRAARHRLVERLARERTAPRRAASRSGPTSRRTRGLSAAAGSVLEQHQRRTLRAPETAQNGSGGSGGGPKPWGRDRPRRTCARSPTRHGDRRLGVRRRVRRDS